MRKMSRSWIVLAILAGLSTWTLAQQQAQVSTGHINAKKGISSNFTCESQGSPITYCIWERQADPNKKLQRIFIEFAADSRPGQQSRTKPGYFLTGDGLDKGQCGLKINRVEDYDNGVWQCTLITNTGAQSGQVHLSILQKPSSPQFVDQLQPMVEDNRSSQPEKITCYSTNGVPRPKFQWFIGEDEITNDLTPLNETTSGESLYTFQELKNHRFSFRDNGKKLRCIVLHEALSETDMKEVGMVINIKYRPRSVRLDGREGERGIAVQADLGQEKVIFLNVSANPVPRVSWVVDGKVLEQGRNNEVFEPIPMRSIASHMYELALKIKSVDDEVLSKKIEVKVVNDLGTADYVININSASSGSDGLSAGGILGIVFGILVLLIVVAAGVVYTRARGMLCFKGDDGTASEKERMDGESTGGGAAPEEKPAAAPGFGARMSALYANLLKKKDKGVAVPVDEEAPKDKDAKEKEGGDGKEPEKKGDDIVYAELDLARSADEAQRPDVRSDDKTEYAEIVGVVSKDESKKTPEGSPKK